MRKYLFKKWKEAFQSRPDDKITIVWECLNMTGYETQARIQWQETLKELQPQIKDIWLISDSNLIKTGARVMSVFTSLNIHIVDSEEDIVFSQ